MDINMTAMEVIMNACAGRDKIDEAFAKMYSDDFSDAELLLKEAEAEILKAHIAQTKVIQGQASGDDTEYSLLFIHAQDTIMTSNSELRIAKNILPILKKQQNLIDNLRKGAKNDNT